LRNLIDIEGLLDASEHPSLHEILFLLLHGEASEQDHFYPRLNLTQRLVQSLTVHFWHYEIAHDEVSVLALEDLQGFLPAFGEEDMVIEQTEYVTQRLAHGLVVFYDQDNAFRLASIIDKLRKGSALFCLVSVIRLTWFHAGFPNLVLNRKAIEAT
jgi:hypothetical protein